MDYVKEALKLHEELKDKIEVCSRVMVDSREALRLAYTPGVDAIPLCVRSKDVDDIVNTVALLAGSFGGVNLEDISAPRCFEIEEKLKQRCDIPVFHDDQHGTAVVSTGRSDYPNQVNNVLAFHGIFRGALDARASDINTQMKIAAEEAIASLVSDEELNSEYILPLAFDPRVKEAVAKAVYDAAHETGVARI